MSKKKKTAAKKPKPKQERLPGVENKLSDLHETAMEYAEARDERQRLLQEEVSLKVALLNLMKKHGLENYNYENVSVSVIHEEETVKVRIRKQKEETAEAV